MKTCVVSVAFRHPYVEHSLRQERFIKETNPEIDLLYFRDVLPAKGIIHEADIVSHFQKSLYGFKPHAIQIAIDKGYEKVIWLDPSVLPVVPLDVLIKSLDEHPVIVRTGDNPLVKMTNQKALDWFGVTAQDIEGVNHVGGTIYAFNFKTQEAIDVFFTWKRAEENGIFGDQDAFMKGHWADESCMALSLHTNFAVQYWEEGFSYLNQKEMPV